MATLDERDPSAGAGETRCARSWRRAPFCTCTTVRYKGMLVVFPGQDHILDYEPCPPPPQPVQPPPERHETGLPGRSGALEPGFHSVQFSPAYADRDADGAGVTVARSGDAPIREALIRNAVRLRRTRYPRGRAARSSAPARPRSPR